jgi:hypothetical protein
VKIAVSIPEARKHERGSSPVELLIASTVGMLAVAAAVSLLRTHAALALDVQTALGAVGGASWALRVVLPDVRHAGGDPQRRGFPAVASGGRESVVLLRDRDGDGSVDPDSEETVRLAWSASSEGRLVRRIGAQSMAVAGAVPYGGLRFRYFDELGEEIDAEAPLDDATRERIRRIAVELDVVERLGLLSSTARLTSAASLRLREGPR